MMPTFRPAHRLPDGYTLVMGGVNTHGMYDALVKSPRYDSLKSFTPITLTARIPIAFVVHPSLPAESLADLLRLEGAARPVQLRLVGHWRAASSRDGAVQDAGGRKHPARALQGRS